MIIKEKLVVKFLKEEIKLDTSRLENSILQNHGTNNEVVGEEAVALQLLSFNGKTLFDVLTAWGVIDQLPKICLESAKDLMLNTKVLAYIDLFATSTQERLTGVESVLCLVSIGKKTSSNKPLPSFVPGTKKGKPKSTKKKESMASDDNDVDGQPEQSIDYFVKNVSNDNFFVNTPKYKEHFEVMWNQTTSKYSRVCYLRVVISYSGFTADQVEIVRQFNRKFPEQPIVLVSPYDDWTGNNIYGPKIYKHFLSQMKVKATRETNANDKLEILREKLQKLQTENKSKNDKRRKTRLSKLQADIQKAEDKISLFETQKKLLFASFEMKLKAIESFISLDSSDEEAEDSEDSMDEEAENSDNQKQE